MKYEDVIHATNERFMFESRKLPIVLHENRKPFYEIIDSKLGMMYVVEMTAYEGSWPHA